MSEKACSLGGGRPTRRDVARLANVSGTTVSRVLGGRPDESVSPKARDRVLEAARQLGYVPNPAAQALRSGHSGLIGFWMCLEYSRYRGEVLDRMRRTLATSEFALSVADVDEDYAWHYSLERALRVPVEGVIAFDASLAAEAFAQNSARLAPNLPFVSMGAFWSEAKSYVGVDLKAGAVQAMEHLFATGRRRIAYVVQKDSEFAFKGARYEGYRDMMLAAGLEPRTLGITDTADGRTPTTAQVLAECRAEGSLPDALLCLYDDIAVDAVPALYELGLEPGRDVAIVGFNGSEGIDRGPCPISSVRQPVEKMCALAYEFLKAQIEDPSASPQQVILKPELVVRQSSQGT